MKENLSSSSIWSSIGQKLHKNKKNLISVLLFLLLAALTFSAICKGNDMTEVAKAVRKWMCGISLEPWGLEFSLYRQKG